MRSASFVMEGTEKQAEVTSAILRRVWEFYDWKYVVAYELDQLARIKLQKSVSEIREAWWPVARRLLLRCGDLDLDELSRLDSSIEDLNADIRAILGSELLAKLLDPVDAYYVTGAIPLEWTFLDGYPLCLYAPFYRFAKPQDLFSMYAPLTNGAKLVIAPCYSKPQLSGINDAVEESAILVRNDSSVTLLEGEVTTASLKSFQSKQFARLLFHGHGTIEGLLCSDGALIPYQSVLELVQGPAFLLGCSTGAFELGTLHTVMQQIPRGLHGALLTAFPISGDYTRTLNLMVMGTFRLGDARRVQDIAHMSRLALAYIGLMHAVTRLARLPIVNNVVIVTPFEANYDQYDRWGAGVKILREAVQQLRSEDIRQVVLPTATAFAMAVTSCGTPAFLLPDADPLLINLWKRFSSWDGKA